MSKLDYRFILIERQPFDFQTAFMLPYY